MTQKIWMPDRPAENYTDAAVALTPLYRALRKINEDLSAEALVNLTRANIQCKWDANRRVIEQVLVERIDEMLTDADYAATKVTIDRQEGTIKQIRDKRGSRFAPADYVPYIGQTFTTTKTSIQNPERNGEYKLIVGKPPELNGQSGAYTTSAGKPYDVSLTIVDPDGYEIRYPARFKRKPKSCKTYREASSISKLFQLSKAKGAQTPAVVFGLKKKKKQQENVNDDDDDDDEDTALANRLVREYRAKQAANGG